MRSILTVVLALLIVRRDSGLQFDPTPGFHLYGADFGPQARERGLAVVALSALCHHNSRSVGLPEAFFRSAEVFARKWSHRLPVATPCVIVDRGGAVHILGNATAAPRSIAYASIVVFSPTIGDQRSNLLISVFGEASQGADRKQAWRREAA
jgi:hypothetical protein